MWLPGAKDHFTKVLIHRDHESLFPDRQSEYSSIRHPRIQVTNCYYVEALTCEPVLYSLSDAYINKDFHGVVSNV